MYIGISIGFQLKIQVQFISLPSHMKNLRIQSSKNEFSIESYKNTKIILFEQFSFSVLFLHQISVLQKNNKKRNSSSSLSLSVSSSLFMRIVSYVYVIVQVFL